ncbi:MAG: DUF3613 domain-containing protein [Aquabacterium sp.]
MLLLGHAACAQQTPDAAQDPSTVSQQGDEASRKPAPSIGDGQSTRLWLAKQQSGAQASPHRQAMSGPVMRIVHQRYIDSFSKPIPEWVSKKNDF